MQTIPELALEFCSETNLKPAQRNKKNHESECSIQRKFVFQPIYIN